MADISSRTVDWWSVHEFVLPTLTAVGSWPRAGTPAWIDLDEDDPRKVAAVLDGGRKWALHLDGRQEAMAQASRDVAEAVDCQSIARGVLRQDWRRNSRFYIPRDVA